MSITAGILAGGQSRRFGSDKAWALLDGKPLIEHLIDSVRPQVDTILVSVRTITPAYRALGVPLVPDDQSDLGPLAGVVALLRACPSDWLLLLPCDAVEVTAGWAQRMLLAARAHAALLVVRDDGERIHPTFALLHCSLRDDAAAALERGERSLHRWQQGIAARVVLTTEVPMNVNTATELHQLHTRAGAEPTP